MAATAAGLPLAGTAPVARAWLIIEQRIPFAERALTSDRIDPRIPDLAEGTAATTLLARRERHSRSPERFWYADVAESHYATGHLTDLIEALSTGGTPMSAASTLAPDPALFLCTNGKRDQCCAIESRPVLDRLVHREDVWECSHLGGHRFAATALVLPTGYVYGRLSAASAESALGSAARGEVSMDGARGRSDLPSAHQTADLAVRRQGQQPGTRLTTARTLVADADSAQVEVAYDDGRFWHVVVASTTTAALAESCGRDPVQLRTWQAQSVVEIS